MVVIPCRISLSLNAMEIGSKFTVLKLSSSFFLNIEIRGYLLCLCILRNYGALKKEVNQQLLAPTVGKRDLEISSLHSELRFVHSFS